MQLSKRWNIESCVWFSWLLVKHTQSHAHIHTHNNNSHICMFLQIKEVNFFNSLQNHSKKKKITTPFRSISFNALPMSSEILPLTPLFSRFFFVKTVVVYLAIKVYSCNHTVVIQLWCTLSWRNHCITMQKHLH